MRFSLAFLFHLTLTSAIFLTFWIQQSLWGFFLCPHLLALSFLYRDFQENKTDYDHLTSTSSKYTVWGFWIFDAGGLFIASLMAPEYSLSAFSQRIFFMLIFIIPGSFVFLLSGSFLGASVWCLLTLGRKHAKGRDNV